MTGEKNETLGSRGKFADHVTLVSQNFWEISSIFGGDDNVAMALIVLTDAKLAFGHVDLLVNTAFHWNLVNVLA